jgi:ABC-type amino acid transport substrate-binding protein
MTSRQREAELLPIRIPLLRGLLGVRLIMVRQEDADRLSAVRSVADLADFRVGQGLGWPDTDILRANGLDIVTGDQYKGLFEMLALGRFDLFPRGITEAWDEVAETRGLVVEPNILLIYPTAIYFFVHPDAKALADRIERGLRMAIQDGSFDALFQEHTAESLALTQPETRRILRLHNPLLPDLTPLEDRTLWAELPGLPLSIPQPNRLPP